MINSELCAYLRKTPGKVTVPVLMGDGRSLTLVVEKQDLISTLMKTPDADMMYVCVKTAKFICLENT